MQTIEENISALIAKSIQQQVEEIVAAEAKEAAARIEQKVRAMTGQIASRVLEKFSFETFGTTIRIEVDFSSLKEKHEP